MGMSGKTVSCFERMRNDTQPNTSHQSEMYAFRLRMRVRACRNAWMLSRTRVKMFAQVHPRTGMQARYNKGCIMKDTQWWCRGADFNRIMSTDRRDSTELFRVNAPPTPERKLLMETGQLPLAHAPLDWTLCFLYGSHFRFFLFLSFFSNSYDSPLVFLSLLLKVKANFTRL